MCTSNLKGHITAIKSDLRNLHHTQTEFLAQHGRYATREELYGPQVKFQTSTGATMLFRRVNDSSYVATVTHTYFFGSCGIVVGPQHAGRSDLDYSDIRCTDIDAPNIPSPEPERSMVNMLLAFVLTLAVLTSIYHRRHSGFGKWAFRGMLALAFVAFAGGMPNIDGCKPHLTAPTVAAAIATLLFGALVLRQVRAS
jgi:hypothetical protein